jgi:hypothetical protein
MNLVKLITDQLTGEAINKLSSLLGADSESTTAAAHAAVPSLLAGLAGLASHGDGAKRLTDALGGLDPNLGNISQLIGGDSSNVAMRGAGLLSSLFGDNTVGRLANALSGFSGLSSASAKSLLTYLIPVVLGKVGGQWKSQGGTTSALASLFADQKQNIAAAVPNGFSLSDVPGFGRATEAARSTVRKAETVGAAAGPSAAWIIPVALLLLGGFFLWQYLQAHPAAVESADRKIDQPREVTSMKPVISDSMSANIPDAAHMTGDLTSIFQSLGTSLAGIKDAASAEAAAPKLEEVKSKLDGMSDMFNRLPETNRMTINQFVKEHVDTLQKQAAATTAIPGISAQIRALISEIVEKLTRFAQPPENR